MKSRAVLIGFAVAIGCGAARAGESTGYEQPGYWKCQNIRASATTPLYVSDIFEMKADPAEVNSAFQQMLAGKYGVKAQPSCSMAYKNPGILEKLRDDDQRWFAQVRAAGAKVVETHWAFAPAAAKFVYQCWGGAQVAIAAQRTFSFFYADPIELPGENEAGVNTAWATHLAEVHPELFFAGSQGCQRLPADPSTHASVIASIMDPWKARSAEMHKLDWTYAPSAKSAVATPAAATAPVASSAAPSSGAEHFYQCWKPTYGAYYMTEAFQSAKDQHAIIADWNDYMQSAHPGQAVPRTMANCKILSDDPDARKKEVAFHFATAGGGLVRVDWKD